MKFLGKCVLKVLNFRTFILESKIKYYKNKNRLYSIKSIGNKIRYVEFIE